MAEYYIYLIPKLHYSNYSVGKFVYLPPGGVTVGGIQHKSIPKLRHSNNSAGKFM